MKRQYTIILAVLFMIFYNVASGLQFADCGSDIGELTKTNVSGCDTTSHACVLKRGTKVQVIIGFHLKKPEPVTAVRAIVFSKLKGVTLHWRFKNSDGCLNSGLRCPLQTGTNYEYKGVLEVLNIYPQASLSIKWELQNQNKAVIACVSIPARIE